MTAIKLQSICLRNFKGTKYLLLNMEGRNACISGANGTGKTTVYKAYYWCLTGKSLEPNEVIQPLNESNEIVHKIETSVTVTLRIDNSYDVVLERKLTEKWKAQGKPNEELKGTEQQRLWNDVPLSKDEFERKLTAICDIEKWLLLSDITKFMSLKMDERRKLLLNLAGEVDEAELMKDYPELEHAVFTERKTIEEVKKQSLSTKKRSEDELKTIPSQISAQDKLKSTEDFEALCKEKDELDTQIADTDKQLQGSTDELEAAKQHKEAVAQAEKRIADYSRKWNESHSVQLDRQRNMVVAIQQELDKAEAEARAHATENKTRIEKKVSLQEAFTALREEWNKENSSEFNYNNADCCPYCGHKFTTEEIATKKEQAIAEFNKHKSERLQEIQDKAENKNEQIVALTGFINEYDKVIRPQDENAVNTIKAALKEEKTAYDNILQDVIDSDEQYCTLKNELKTLQESTSTEDRNDNGDLKQKKTQLVSRRDEVIRLLAGQETNRHIEEEKERLENRSKELAQIIADCDKMLYQITEYRKQKVAVLEDKVNSFFSLARWKFFEKNVTNDGLQEVCICHHNGVDYNSTNDSDRINLCIDIVAGLSKAYNICAPLFIDRAESVNKIITTENQQIALRVTTDEFTMK